MVSKLAELLHVHCFIDVSQYFRGSVTESEGSAENENSHTDDLWGIILQETFMYKLLYIIDVFG